MAKRISRLVLGAVELDGADDEGVWEAEMEWAGRAVQVDVWSVDVWPPRSSGCGTSRA